MNCLAKSLELSNWAASFVGPKTRRPAARRTAASIPWRFGAVTTGAVAPTWVVDPAASQPLNRAIRDWHADYFTMLKAAGIGVVVSFSQELVNPPDNPAGGVNPLRSNPVHKLT
jgi:hypothetical protein